MAILRRLTALGRWLRVCVWPGLLLTLLCWLSTGPHPAAGQSEPPAIRLSELHVDPRAVRDQYGEWIELANTGDAAVDLQFWTLVSSDTEQHTFMFSLTIQPGQYLVLARSADPSLNGGIQPAYVYTELDLANAGDSLVLLDPNGQEVDRLVWGEGTGLAVTEGASLERTGPDGGWTAAHSRWTGSAGDRGSPGLPYSPPPTATPVVPPTPTAAPSPTETPLPTSTPPPAVPPRLALSELMIDPAAVADDQGEWIELVNLDAAPVDLAGWSLADLDRDHFTLPDTLWVQPGQYVVLARRPDPAANGGVQAAAGYAKLQLANEQDELILIAPWGVTVDQLVWGKGGAAAARGASLERTGFGPGDGWVAAHTLWPGSAGDLGSPGAPYVAPTPLPTATSTPPPTATPMPTATPSATVTPTGTPVPAATPLPATPLPVATPTPLPATWLAASASSPLLLDEVYYHSADQEFIVLRNAGSTALDLGGWLIGDAAAPGANEGMLALPAGVVLAPGQLYVLARHGAAFQARWGRAPDAEWNETDPAILTLAARRDLAGRELALNDDGDEVVLIDPEGHLADALAYGDATYRGLDLAGALAAGEQASFQQVPGAAYPGVRDLRDRFLLAAPDPFASVALPAAQPHAPVPLEGGLLAVWGSLGAYSTFSPGGTAPPHYLLAAAAAQGLDFLAIADTDRDPAALLAAGPETRPAVALPAWRWQNPAGASAIVYSTARASLLSWADLLGFLAGVDGLAQVAGGDTPVDPRLAVLTADTVSAPGDLALLPRCWQAAGMPLLPAGNTNPPLPGYRAPAPRYTGLAVSEPGGAAIQAALAARRGWLTSTPGLWLTLRTAAGQWMGERVAPANELALLIQVGDLAGAASGLALWQDDQIVRQLDLPPTDGRWSVTIPAVPGSFLFAVATQLDGDFAVTAPLYVETAAGGAVLLNEVLPAPAADHNGDGSIDLGDEFVELFNPGRAPLALAGWQLADSRGEAPDGHRFTLEPGRVIGAGAHLLLWRQETGLSLNDAGDRLSLWSPDGSQVDVVAWQPAPGAGGSLSRVPDGGAWQRDTPPSPGETNRPAPTPLPPAVPTPPPELPPQDEDEDDDDLDPPEPLPPGYGQASGPPASLAAAKLQGLEMQVEFRGQVVVPPGLFNSAIYVAEPARTLDGVSLPVAGLGLQVYLQGGEFMPLAEGDWVLVRGVLKSFRGEMEVQLSEPGRCWPLGPGTPLLPLPVQVGEIGESLEARLVTLTGIVTGWQGDSLYLGDAADPTLPSVRVTVRSSLDWKRPYVHKGEVYQVTGIVSQFAQKAPWNGGYRVLVRYPTDLLRLE